ncbi:response regulator transcription factor [Paenibacillus sp. LjRoot56]|uniref:response regulator transcription factor n=1 Tax=Paenibacillus sp. LjRoot56 TaxID=3342333 RepID=UPI003ECCFE03
MYSMLIVDDEIHVVKGLMASMNLESLHISSIHSAYNIRQAKEILLAHRVDIMLCDIEMPQGSGLELLEWVRSYCPNLETIFLTSHADFTYAKQAIQLGCLDYLLKPASDEELEQVVRKAQGKVNQISETNQIRKLWAYHHPVVLERFWLDLLYQVIPSESSAIQSVLTERNLPVTESMLFVPILVSIHRWQKELTLREEKIMEYALKNSAEELIAGKGMSGQILTIDRGAILIILPCEESDDMEALQRNCEAYIDSCRSFFYCELSCYIGNQTKPQQLQVGLEQLKRFEKNNVAFENKVFLLTGAAPPVAISVSLPDMSNWSLYLKQGNGDKVAHDVDAYFSHLIASGEIDAKLLQEFHQNFLQMVYFVLHSKGTPAHQVLCDPSSMEMSRNASCSVKDMMVWIQHTIAKVVSGTAVMEHAAAMVEAVKQYIAEHLSESELSREEIANHAFLNPDYLSRVFKKETGISIMDYLLQERIKLAKELLAKTGMSIGQIALEVGFTYFAYFSKVFRKQTGLNPNEYRQKFGE